MANKKVRNSQGEQYETNTAERISNEFDKVFDVRDTFTLRIMCNMQGCKDDSVKSAIMLALKQSGSSSANVKVRFTRDFALEHFDEIYQVAKEIQLENEARIYEVRSHLSSDEQENGKKIAFQNYALMLLKSMVPSTVSEDNFNLALRNTGSWYTPDNAVFNLKLDFVGLSQIKSGLNLEKEISVTDSSGDEKSAFRVITEVGGMRSCPISDSNKNHMADMLYDILVSYDLHFKNTVGSDMNQLLNSLKTFCREYRKHDNKELMDTRLSDDDKKKAENWAKDAYEWLVNS